MGGSKLARYGRLATAWLGVWAGSATGQAVQSAASFGNPAEAGSASAPGVVWFFDDPTAVPETVALSDSTRSAWVGQDLNSQRLLRFVTDGDGTVLQDIPRTAGSEFLMAAAKSADLAVAVTETSTIYVEGFNSAGGSRWAFPVPTPYTDVAAELIAVSRDGSIVCCAAINPWTPQGGEATRLFILNGNTGQLLRTWDYPARCHGIDLSDDGRYCLITQSEYGRLVDTTGAIEIFTGSVSGPGGFGKISGDGSAFILGGNNLRIYRKSGADYILWLDYFPVNEFFSQVAISRDGSTALGLSSDPTFLITRTRAWDVPGKQLLGSSTTTGTGFFQDTPSGAACSGSGDILAVASWGTAYNEHPEVRIFDRGMNLVGQLDLPGSPLWIDLGDTGQFLLVGSKARHANDLSSGGRTTCFRVFSTLPIESAVSRKTHGTAGSFDLDVLRAGAVEGRSGGPTQFVVTFGAPVYRATGTVSDVSLSSGSISSVSLIGQTLTVNLSGAATGQPLQVWFPGVLDEAGTPVGESFCLGVLLAENSGDRAVNIFDLLGVRAKLNQAVTAANYRMDIMPDGSINIFDLLQARSRLNTSVPACP